MPKDKATQSSPELDFSQVQGPGQPPAGELDFSQVRGPQNLPTQQTPPDINIFSPQAFKEYGETLAKGIGEQALDWTTAIGSGIHQLGEKIHPGLGERIVPSAGLQAEKVLATPAPGTAQDIVKGVSGIAPYLIPGVGEEAGPAIAARYGPRVAQATRIGLNALQAGTINKLQGGGFTEGAIGAGVGEAIGAIGRRVAPKLLETGMGIGEKERAYRRGIGQTGLDYTKGITPAAVGQSATNEIEKQMDNIRQLAYNYKYKGGAYPPNRIDLQPSVNVLDSLIDDAKLKQNAPLVKQLEEVKDTIAGTDLTTGQPMFRTVDAERAAKIKTGLRDRFIKHWDPQRMEGVRDAALQASGRLDSEMDKTLGPGFTRSNEIISNLIPLEERAERMGRQASLIQLMRSRWKAHTGALLGTIYGAHAGGLPGAIAGATIPELVGSPEFSIALSRIARSPLVPRIATGGINVGRLQLQRPQAFDQR